MNFNSSSKQNNNQSEPSAYGAWAALIGLVVGTGIGLATHRWLVWAVVSGVVGGVIGAFMDRARR